MKKRQLTLQEYIKARKNLRILAEEFKVIQTYVYKQRRGCKIPVNLRKAEFTDIKPDVVIWYKDNKKKNSNFWNIVEHMHYDNYYFAHDGNIYSFENGFVEISD